MSKKGPARRHHARVTIEEVARAAGVSPMTVSRVVNGEPNVREETRAAVDAAVRRLGYTPNRAARNLASATQIQIGLLYANPSSTYLSAVLLGVLEQARQSDVQIVVVECTTGPDAIAAARRLVKSGIDGILLTPPLCDASGILELVRKTRTLAVTIGAQHIDRRIASVSIDDYQASMTMMQHLLTLGHRRIGFITGSPEVHASERRLEGYRASLQDAGIELREELIAAGEFSYRSGLAAAERLLKLDSRPTAIFAANDEMAAAAIASAHRLHIDVPGVLSVCGFDDTLLATTIWPEITTIRQPIAEMSRRAITVLEERIRARRARGANPCAHLTLDYELIRRDSDAAPPTDEAINRGGRRRAR